MPHHAPVGSFAHHTLLAAHPDLGPVIDRMGGWQEVIEALSKEIFFSRFLIGDRAAEHRIVPATGESPEGFFHRRFPVLLESYRLIGVPDEEALMTAAVEVELLWREGPAARSYATPPPRGGA